MDSNIKQAIDEKINSIVESYRIEDATLMEKLEQLRRDMEELGESATDVADFEAKFAGSPLIRVYSDLYSEIMQKCALIDPIDEMPSDNDDFFFEKQMIKDKTHSMLGSIPVVGSVLRTKNRIDYIKNRKNYMDDEDDE